MILSPIRPPHTPRVLFIAALFLYLSFWTPGLLFAQCTYPESFGNPTVNISNIDVSQFLPASPVTLSAPGTVTGMAENLGPAGGQLQMAIYTDVGNAPGNLVIQTGAQTAVPNAWNTIGVSVTLAAGTYWLAGAESSNGTGMPGNSIDGKVAYTVAGYTF